VTIGRFVAKCSVNHLCNLLLKPLSLSREITVHVAGSLLHAVELNNGLQEQEP